MKSQFYRADFSSTPKYDLNKKKKISEWAWFLWVRPKGKWKKSSVWGPRNRLSTDRRCLDRDFQIFRISSVHFSLHWRACDSVLNAYSRIPSRIFSNQNIYATAVRIRLLILDSQFISWNLQLNSWTSSETRVGKRAIFSPKWVKSLHLKVGLLLTWHTCIPHGPVCCHTTQSLTCIWLKGGGGNLYKKDPFSVSRKEGELHALRQSRYFITLCYV